MKKTLLLTHEYYPYRGGVARYCYNLFRMVPTSGYVVLTDQKGAAGENVIVQPLLSRVVWPRWLMGIVTVARIARQHHCEIIVTPHILPLGAIAYGMKSLFRMPYVLSLHGLDILSALERRPAFTKRILRNASAIIVNSEATKQLLADQTLAVPVTVLTPSLDLSMIRVNEIERSVLKEKYKGKKIILTIGRLVRRKGQDMVIHAMKQILAVVPTAYYIIVGDGPDKEYFGSVIAEEQMEDCVAILSDIDDEDIGAYYAIAAAYAMPSRRRTHDVEGFGIVYLEAASFGLPIVAGNSGGEHEAVGDEDSAIVVDGRDVPAIAESIICLLDDDELAHHIGKAGKRHLKTMPTSEEQSARFIELLSKL